jgi:ribonuclease HI
MTELLKMGVMFD